MAKRTAAYADDAANNDDGLAAYNKRQKITHHNEAPVGEDITSSGQLRKLLSFDQDLRNAKYGESSLMFWWKA